MTSVQPYKNFKCFIFLIYQIHKVLIQTPYTYSYTSYSKHKNKTNYNKHIWKLKLL